jgi:transcriptional regulator with XRE-family HTH domain
MGLTEIARRLKAMRPEVVAVDTGLSMSTVYKYREGRAKNPPHETLRTLSEYLKRNGKRRAK